MRHDLLVAQQRGALPGVLPAAHTYTKGLVWLCLIFAPSTADEQKRPKALEVFSIFPTKGILEAREGEAPTREILQISFAARYS